MIQSIGAFKSSDVAALVFVPWETRSVVTRSQAAIESGLCTSRLQIVAEPASRGNRPTSIRPRANRDLTRLGFPRGEPDSYTPEYSDGRIRCMFDFGFRVGFVRCQNQVKIPLPGLDLFGLSEGDLHPSVPRGSPSGVVIRVITFESIRTQGRSPDKSQSGVDPPIVHHPSHKANTEGVEIQEEGPDEASKP